MSEGGNSNIKTKEHANLSIQPRLCYFVHVQFESGLSIEKERILRLYSLLCPQVFSKVESRSSM